MRRLAVLSMHTSPLAQAGTGDGGGMNVYVRELAAALARTGVGLRRLHPGLGARPARRWSRSSRAAGPPRPGRPAGPVAKEALPERGGRVHRRGARPDDRAGGRDRRRGTGPFEAIHANYWLSGLAGHAIKHELDLPLVSTFHTLDRVKAEAGPEEVEADMPHRRAEAEAAIIRLLRRRPGLLHRRGRPDRRALRRRPGPDRAWCRPGSTTPSSGPGHRPQARRALGLPADGTAAALRRADPAAEGGRRGGRGRWPSCAGPAGGVPTAWWWSAGRAARGATRPTTGSLAAGRPTLGVADRVTMVDAPAPRAALHLLPGRRRLPGAQPLGVLRPGGPGGGGLRDPGGGLGRRRPDHPGRPRPHRLPGRAGRRRRPSPPPCAGSWTSRCWPSGMSTAAVLRARDYTWREAAARLRAIHDELVAGRLVECS